MHSRRLFVLGCLVTLCLNGCAGDKPCPRSADDAVVGEAKLAIPEFVLTALQSNGALRVKLYIAKDGTLRKSAVYVTKESVPTWVHEMADEKLGKGEDESYEVEQYADGQQVYEVTRKVDGVSQELAITIDKSVLYLERKLPENELPEKVATALKGLENFTMEEAESKTYTDGRQEFEVEGKQGEVHVVLQLSTEGEIVGQSRKLTATIAVDK